MMTFKIHPTIRLLFLTLVQVAVYILIVFTIYRYAFNFAPSFSGHRLTTSGFKFEATSLIVIGLFFFILLKRFYLSLIVTILLYLTFILINLEKINYLFTPLLPSDIFYINQLILAWTVLEAYIPIILIILILFISLFYIFIKYETKNLVLKNKSLMINITLITILILVLFNSLSIKNILKDNTKKGRAHLVSSSEKYGLLYVFLKNTIYNTADLKPKGYTHENINKINSNLKLNFHNTNKNKDDNISLIIYLIESFSDPVKAGIRTTKDPIPFMHKLQKEHFGGSIYSPVVGGRSANAEFELLTGFTMQFFPKSSIPYIDLPKRSIPSLANELNNKDYYTSVIQAVDLGFFNYKQMYGMQGFQNVTTLFGDKNVEIDAAKRFPSDNSIVDEIIKQSNKHNNFFIFAFPNSTHGKWKYTAYDNSSLDLITDEGFSYKTGRKQLRTYINALNTADKSIKKLVDHFKTKKRKVAILVLGDHQPGLPEFREHFMLNNYKEKISFNSRKQLKKEFNKIDENDPLAGYEIMHTVPFALWTNFKNDKVGFNSYQKGMNSLILIIFDTLKIEPISKFYLFLKEYSQSISFESLLKYLYYNKDELLETDRTWNHNYELIQYDYLYGSELLKKLNTIN